IPSLLLLAFLAEDVFALITDTLALVWLRRPVSPDLRRNLTDELLVDAGDGDHLLPCATDLHVDPRRDLVHDVVAEADRQLYFVLALELGAEADAVDLERVRVAFRHALDQIGQRGARHAPHRPCLLAVIDRLDNDLAVALLGPDLIRKRELELALGAFEFHRLARDRRRDARGYRNRLLANA